MRIFRIASTIVLLSFVGATVGLIIAQEIAYASIHARSTVNAATVVAGSDGEAPSSELGVDSAREAVIAEEDVIPGDDPGTASEPENAAPEEQTTEVSSEAQVATVSCRVDVIYFHTTFRCQTCKHIEELARAAVEREFVQEMRDGKISWQAINMQEERKYVSLYDLTRPTLVLVRVVDGNTSEWSALHDTWSLLGSRSAFDAYVRDHVRSFLERCP